MNEDQIVSLDLFFSYSFDLLAVVGADGYFKQVNPAFEKTMGYTPEELYAQPIVEFLHPDDVNKTKNGIQKLTSGSPTIASKNRYRCKNGNYKWFSWNTNSLGTLFYTVGRDITEQVNAEERIRHLNDELEKKNEVLEIKIQERMKELQKSEAQVRQLQKMDAIGRLAGGIAHDFNNMLAAISLYCDLLEDDLDPQAILKNAQNIRKATDRAAALTAQLLIFSRKQIIQLQTVSLNPIIKQIEQMLIRLIGQNIQFTTNLENDLKNVSVDPSQMEQVILNLVVNARDALPDGGTIIVETKNVYLDETFTSTHLSVDKGHYVLLMVSDNGLGMDEETLNKIFEPFFTTKSIGKGTGLGLTTTYGIVKQCHGTIWVYSELNKGTIFKIYLPVADDVLETFEPESPVLSKAVEGQTILLVEDDEGLRRGFATILRKRGYQVLETQDGSEALQICKSYEKPIHLMLTDVVMPGFSGFELAEKILTLRGDLRIVYMSGYTNEALEKSGKDNLDQMDFIQKPFSSNILVAKVQEVLLRASK